MPAEHTFHIQGFLLLTMTFSMVGGSRAVQVATNHSQEPVTI